MIVAHDSADAGDFGIVHGGEEVDEFEGLDVVHAGLLWVEGGRGAGEGMKNMAGSGKSIVEGGGGRGQE